MERVRELKNFYQGKRVFITGHTGFKGSWMCKVLSEWGADVIGYALEAPTTPSLYDIANISTCVKTVIGDIREREKLITTLCDIQPEIVIHMAAQPIVRDSYKNPVYTYETNVMGTVNILEAIRNCLSVRSFVNVTTDKVYLNKEWHWGYRENEELNGYDPYSNSKSCSELVTSSYKNAFFQERKIAISTCRAGNVIGGGDFANDRIIPDCVRAVQENKDIVVRNPYSTRPYQHVLEPVMAYLLLAMYQYEDIKVADSYNIGPDEADCWQTGKLVSLFCDKWNELNGTSVQWRDEYDGGPHEANFLKLDCSKMKATFDWKPRWDLETTMEKIVEWNRIYFAGADVSECMRSQIVDYLQGM